MATAKAPATAKPLIQVDEEIREMTDAEYAEYLEIVSSPSAPIGE